VGGKGKNGVGRGRRVEVIREGGWKNYLRQVAEA